MTLPDEIFERFLEAIPDAALAVAPDGRIAHANSRAEALFGYPAGSFARRSHDLLVPAASRLEHRRSLGEFFSRPGSRAMAAGREIAGRRADGSEFPAECFLSRVEVQGLPCALVVVRDLTERRCTEQGLRAGEARYRQLFEANPHPMWVYDLETLAFLAVNDAAVRKYGYSRDEFLGMTIADIRPPEDVPALRRNVARVSEGLDEAGVWRHVKKDGTVLGVEIVSHTLSWEGCRAELVLAHDVTDRVRAEEALRRSEERFRLAMEVTRDGLWDWNVASGYTYYSPSYFHMLGLDPGELPSRVNTWLDRIHPDDRDRAWEANRACVEGAVESFEVEFRMRHKNGSWRWILGRGKSVARDASGRALRLVGTHTDVTERRHVEEELRAREQQLRVIFDASQAGIIRVDSQGTIVFANQRMAEMLGLDLADVIGTPYTAHVHESERALGDERMRQLIRGEIGSVSTERHYVRADGSDFWGYLSGRRLENEDGTLRALVGIIADITERKQAEEALRQRQEQLEKIVATSPGVVCSFRLGADGSVTMPFAGQGIETFYGVSPEQLAQDASIIFRRVHRDDVRRVQDTIAESARALGPWRAEFRVHSPSGSELWLEGHSIPRREPDGSVLWHGIVLDVTDRKRAEKEHEALQAQLAQAQKMEAVGRLAGGVAHDFNNMLAVILGRAELVLRRVDPEDPLCRDLEEILQAAERSSVLTRQLLAFARRQTVSPRVLDVNEAVGAMLQMLRRLIGEEVDLAWVPGPGVWSVRIDPSQLDQLLANLVVNARDAISGTGRVTLETRNVTLTEAVAARGEVLLSGEYVLLTVSDDGCGMDEETLAHLFEPFFTTKGPGQGTGLGLATVYGIVRQNGGLIDAQGQPGRGSTFRVYLPRAVEEGTEKAVSAVKGALPGGDETLLLVEDEEAILTLGREMLQRLGYRVLTAGSPSEALRVAEAHAGEIHLLITDVVMPEMDGHALSERLADARPGLPCLFLSGYPADVIAPRGVLDEGVRLLEKPFTLRQLAEKVREMLQGEASVSRPRGATPSGAARGGASHPPRAG
ncbi:MAG: PAS domain S-box protein [Deltaproteobacteria bacterium]|nr:PAS domain S-box protein [Deltaproteobacteria bacterium]